MSRHRLNGLRARQRGRMSGRAARLAECMRTAQARFGDPPASSVFATATSPASTVAGVFCTSRVYSNQCVRVCLSLYRLLHELAVTVCKRSGSLASPVNSLRISLHTSTRRKARAHLFAACYAPSLSTCSCSRIHEQVQARAIAYTPLFSESSLSLNSRSSLILASTS